MPRRHRAYRSPYSGAEAETERGNRIFWSPENNAYAVKTVGNGGPTFSQDMRLLDNSRWDGLNKVWLVGEDQLQLAIDMVMDHFKIIPEVEHKPQMGNGDLTNLQVTDAATAALKMFQVGGYDNAKKVYSLLIKQYHPDYNPGPEASAKAAEITVAWKTLKSSLGW